MKTKKEMDSTRNRRVYKSLRKRYLSISKGLVRCEICPYHKCENDRGRKDRRSWKKNRKHQWKEEAI